MYGQIYHNSNMELTSFWGEVNEIGITLNYLEIFRYSEMS